MSSQEINQKGRLNSAELAGKDEDASLEQHAGIELEQVPHIDCHNQLGQVPLVNKYTHKKKP